MLWFTIELSPATADVILELIPRYLDPECFKVRNDPTIYVYLFPVNKILSFIIIRSQTVSPLIPGCISDLCLITYQVVYTIYDLHNLWLYIWSIVYIRCGCMSDGYIICGCIMYILTMFCIMCSFYIWYMLICYCIYRIGSILVVVLYILSMFYIICGCIFYLCSISFVFYFILYIWSMFF